MDSTPDDRTSRADRIAAAVAQTPTQLLIGGRERPGSGRFEVTDPATGQVLRQVSDAGPGDAAAALDTAAAAQVAWAATTPRSRSEILRRAHELMIERTDALATLMTLEMGKSLAESRGEVVYAAEFFRWFAEEAVRVGGSWSRNPAGPGRVLTMRQPVGPCLLITPWNFPLAMGTRKIGPAIAAGCTMIVKPAEQTPLSMLALGRLLVEAGLPEDVLTVLPTSDAAACTGAIIDDRRLRKLSFTGSTAVGRALMADAAPNLLRLSMELGGNAPFLVLADADVDAAVEGAVLAKTRNIGESCVAANRFLVHTAVADEFTEKFTARLAALTTGHGLDDGVDLGPLINDDQRSIADALVRDALDHGASAALGGAIPDGAGSFYPPTVLTDVPAQARILHEEVFAPVAPISVVGSDDEAITRANDTEFGLVAYLYTRDLDRAITLTERLESGMVGVNTGLVSNAAAPFGGVKHSGFGREGGAEGIEEYLSVKYAALGVSG